ncbi:MAG: glycosyltransferase family 39 protein [Candidatus Moraniibacteriota bacterium]
MSDIFWSWKKINRKQKLFLMLFSIILLVGIEFRTYRFHDFLRFNADQSRDATLVTGVLAGTTQWPLLGPKAGGTEFRLGSIFYSFEIVSAKLFGVTPEAMAYPDLLASLLALPLLFLLLRKYFDIKTTAGLTMIFAVSYFAVKYSRFAWNPNSTPFWSLLFLYALYQVVVPDDQKKKCWVWWSAVLGVSLGVGVELHTLLLALLPITLVIVFGYSIWKQKTSHLWKSLAVVVAFALLINTPQIVAEYQTSGANVKSFFGGVSNKQGKGKGLVANISKDALCLSQGNVYMLSGYDVSDTCDTKSLDTASGMLITVAGFIFFFGGMWIFIQSFRRERDEQKKYFLGILLVYLGILWLMLIPLAQEVSMRFYLIAPIMPFLLLGLWLAYARERLGGEVGERIALAVIVLLCLSNVYISATTLRDTGNFMRPGEDASDFEFITLQEAQSAADFIVANTTNKEVVLDGNAFVVFKAGRSIGYLTKQSGVTLTIKTKELTPSPGTPIFTLDKTTKKPENTVYGRPIEKTFIIGRLMLSLSRAQ